jgi:hypothetical protein
MKVFLNFILLHSKNQQMKKIVFLLFLAYCQNTIQAQGFQFHLDGGYSFAVSKSNFGTKEYYKIDTSGNKVLTQDAIYGSYGQGLNISAGATYMFSKNIGVDLDFNHYRSVKSVYLDWDQAYKLRREDNIVLWRATPALVLRAGEKKLTAGIKTGPVIPLGGSFYTTTTNELKTGTPFKDESVFKTSGRATFGWMGSMDLAYNITDNISIYAELKGIMLSILGKQTEMISKKQNGVDVLEEFKKDPNNTWKYNYVTKDPQGDDQLAPYTNINSLGFNIGVRYSLGKKDK